jgi:proline dehydrogenase
VLARHGLGRCRVTQKAGLDDPASVYRSENAEPPDWVMVGTHDTAPIWLVADGWWRDGSAGERARYLAWRLEPDEQRRAGLVATLASSPASLVQAQFADLLACRARNVFVFFADAFGLRDLYNRPGVVSHENWVLRLPADWWERLRGRLRLDAALNLPLALAMALRSRGADVVGGRPDLLEALEREGREGGISVKPTHLGLAIDHALCHASIDRLVTEAARRGRFVRIDMEDHTTTDAALAVHHDLRRRHDNVGIVLQAYLRRTLDDIAALPKESSVRLCKGIYSEPRLLVVGGYQQVRANYLRALERLIERDAWIAIATHDEWLIRESLERLGRGARGWELQMLLGVAPMLRQRLAAEGHRIRVYVPYGPDWYDYSLRRLRENPRIAMHVVRALFGRS